METLNAWEKKNRYRYIYYIPIFQDSLFFRWDELKKSPHLSRNFFLSRPTKQWTRLISGWWSLLGERRGKMTCFFWYQICLVKLLKNHWEKDIDTNFLIPFFLVISKWFGKKTHFLKNHCERMDPRYWWWMQTSGIWGTLMLKVPIWVPTRCWDLKIR